MTRLDHRAEKVKSDLAANIEPVDYSEAMLEYRSWLTGGKVSREARIAYGIRDSVRQSEILEALLISACPPEEIEASFRVPEKSSGIYANLFYDISVFRTDLDRLEYLEDYPDAEGRELKLKALSLGYEFVLFTFASLVPRTAAQKKIVERMFMATAYKAMSMNYNGINSVTTRNAIKHAELMIRAYELLNKINDGDAQDTYDLVSLLVMQDKKALPRKPVSEELV